MSDLNPDSPKIETGEAETPENKSAAPAPDQTEPPRPGPAAAKRRSRLLRLLQNLAIGATGFLGILIVIYFVLWFYAADKIEQGIDRFVTESNAQGNRITVGAVEISGFPGKIRADIEKVDAFFFGGENIRIPAISAEASAWSWRRVAFALPEGLSALTKNPMLDGIDTQHIRGDAYFGRLDGLPVVSLELTNSVFTLSPPLISQVTEYRRRVMAHKLRMSFEPAPAQEHPDAFRFKLGGDIIGLLDEGASEIAEETHYIEKIRLNTFLPLPPPRQLSRERLASWRDAGGEIRVENIDITWWPVHMIGDGTIGLNNGLQPTGRLDLEITGYNTLIDMISAAGLLTDKARKTARIGLNLLARRKEGQETPFIAVPLVIRDNTLTLGPVPVMRIDPVIWPGEARVIQQ